MVIRSLITEILMDCGRCILAVLNFSFTYLHILKLAYWKFKSQRNVTVESFEPLSCLTDSDSEVATDSDSEVANWKQNKVNLCCFSKRNKQQT